MKIGVFLLFLALVVFPQRSLAQQIDPACNSSRGLRVLSGCVSLYCAPQVKERSTRDNLKFIDETLRTFNEKIAAYSAIVTVYQKACQALLKKYCETCPQMNAVNNAIFDLQTAALEAEEISDVVEQQKMFGHFAATVSREESDLRCSAQIPDAAAKAIERKTEITRRFASTKCAK